MENHIAGSVILEVKTKFYITLSFSLICYGFALMVAIPLLSGDQGLFEAMPLEVCIEEGIVSNTCNEYETKDFGGLDITLVGFMGVMYVIIGTLLLSRAKKQYKIMKYGIKSGWDNELS